MSEYVKTLTTKQKETIECMCEHLGWSNKQIAEAVGIHYNTVTKWNKNEQFRAELDKELHRIFSDGAKIALKRMIDIVTNGNDANAFNAAKFLLENNNFKQAEQLDINATANLIKVSIDEDD